MEINKILTKFAQEELVLGYKSSERESIKRSLEHLEKVLMDRIPGRILEIKRFGSYTRNTILPRRYDEESDVDVMVVFDTKENRLTPRTYRQRLHDTIIATYPNSISKKDFPVVKLELSRIVFDIVPAYTERGWYETNYFIPGKSDNWISTKPNDINDALKDKNKDYGDNLVRSVIRLCKHWNASNGYPYESYLMEKWIVNRLFFSGDNLYEKFLSVMLDYVGDLHDVRRLVNKVKEFEGGYWTSPDTNKQLFWLRKLLPGL